MRRAHSVSSRTLRAVTTAVEADDEAVSRAFSAREEWAFAEVYRRYGALLYSVAVNVLGNSRDAEDCFHDALVNVWQRPQSYGSSRGDVRSFLVVCVRNEAISRRRKAGYRERLTRILSREVQESVDFYMEDFVQNRKLYEALAELPEDQRIVLLLAYFGGKTSVQIAGELRIPLGTVKSRISLGLRKLRKSLVSGAER
jgi:RNA polymerase sigma-70 factor (ECF subfamily)